MNKLLENIPEFKSLVLSAISKLYSNEDFSNDEELALVLYANRHNLPVNKGLTELMIEVGYIRKSEFVEMLLDSISLEVTETFKVYYGLQEV